MPRQIDITTLDNAALFYAHQMGEPSRRNRSDTAWTHGPERVAQDLFNAYYKDEHLHLVGVIREELGSRGKARFDELAAKHFTPREDSVFEDLLARHLAVTLDGDHKEGAIGKVEVGQRFLRLRPVEVATPTWLARRREMLAQGIDLKKPGPRETYLVTAPEYWPVYMGEGEERDRDSDAPDPLPDYAIVTDPWGRVGRPVGALNTNVSIAFAQAGVNAALDLLDEGSSNGILRHYTTAQPADPNVAVSGQTLLATNAFSDPAFGNAADGAPDAVATAASISDDSSADATGTATWFRDFSSNDGATPLNPHIDGSIGTGTNDMVVNTAAYVAGAVISISAYTFASPQGPTAT